MRLQHSLPRMFVLEQRSATQQLGSGNLYGLPKYLPAAAHQAPWMLTSPPHLMANNSWLPKLRLRQMRLWSMPGTRSSWSQAPAGRL